MYYQSDQFLVAVQPSDKLLVIRVFIYCHGRQWVNVLKKINDRHWFCAHVIFFYYVCDTVTMCENSNKTITFRLVLFSVSTSDYLFSVSTASLPAVLQFQFQFQFQSYDTYLFSRLYSTFLLGLCHSCLSEAMFTV